jgi:cytidine kinase
MIDHVAFGIIVDDIVFPTGETRMGVLGGGGTQTAWGMAVALGSGERVGLVAGVGDDLDDAILAPMHAAGIDLAGLHNTGLPTPRAWQIMEFNGRRTQIWRVDPEQTLRVQLARRRDALPPAYEDAQVFHWGFHPLVPISVPFARELRAEGRRVGLEPFKAPERPLSDDELHAILHACAVFSPNWLEAVRITGTDDYAAMLARFAGLGAQKLAIRRGTEGADVWDLAAGEGVHVPAVTTTVVDVVGAGNTFCGAMVARLGDGLDEAACHASAAASYMIEQVGLPLTVPTREDYVRRVAEVRAGLHALPRRAVV